RDRVRLRDLLRLEALALEHVEEVGVAADVQLHRLVEMHAALAEEAREDAVRDRRADLRLDVVADDRNAGLLEAPLPVGLTRDEHRHAVHHRAAGGEDLLRVPLGRFLGADREVVDDDVRAGLLENPDDVVGLAGSLFEDLGEVLADSVVRHPTGDLDAGLRHVGELVRVVGMCPDRVGEVLSDLVLRDVERCRELDVRDVVAAQVDVHEAGHELLGIRVLVVLDSLQEGVGAVPYADDRHAYLAVSARAAVLGAVARGHRFLSVVVEPLREGLDDELVDRPLALAGALRELFLQLERHAQEDVALLARTAALAAGALEGDGETGSEDADRKVVEVALGRFDLAGEVALEVRGHAD